VPVATPCPPASRLRDLALGFIRENEIPDLEQHILACDACVAAMANLTDSDGLADAMRQVASARVPHDKEVHCAIERACRLRAEVHEAGSGDTAESIDETNVPQPTAPPDLARLIAQVLSPPKAANELGWLGPYRVLQLLGYGGMGLLFLAEDGQLRRRVALKVMQPRLAAAADARSRFLREARAAAALKHDNIVTVYHVGEDRGIFWLAMELLEGEPLDRRLKQQGPLPLLEAVQIGRQVAEALAAAHAHGVIHRDIKPGNIWLEAPRQRAKVLDFGLARAVHDEAELTQSGDIVGTPAYMSPEQARGDAVDHRSDLFSLGCLLYCMLVGKTPFGGKSTMSTLSALATETAAPVGDHVPNVPAALNELISTLLLKEPADRPQTAAEVARALTDIEAALIPGTLPPAPPICNSSVPPPAPPPIASRPRSALRIPRIALVIASGVLLGGLALAGVLLQIKTSAGTIVVEIDQPELVGAEVSVDDQHRITIKSADGKEPIRVVADEKEHSLKVTKGGFETFTQHFIVKAGKSQTIRVQLDPLANGSIEPSRTTATKYAESKSLPASRAKVGGEAAADASLKSGEWVALFNHRDLEGWKPFDDAAGHGQPWHVVDACLVGTPETGTTRIGTERLDFANFHLRLEARITGELLGWTVIRASEDPYAAHYRLPMFKAEVNTVTKNNAGKTAIQLLEKGESMDPIRAGEWFVQEVIASDDQITALINGKQVVTLKDVARRSMSGAIEIGRGRNTTIEIRKIEIKELPPRPVAGSIEQLAPAAARSEWFPLFNGKDLNGWKSSPFPKADRAGNWEVQSGVIISSAARQARLVTESEIRGDFAFRAELMITAKNSGVCKFVFAHQRSETEDGDVNTTQHAFALYHDSKNLIDTDFRLTTERDGFVPGVLQPGGTAPAIELGKWCLVELRVTGRKIELFVDGKKVSEHERRRNIPSGAIGFMVWNGPSVSVRKAELNRMP
jgi:serine/threonine protein kinase